MENNKLWAVNIPEEPDSEDILYPVPSEQIGLITVKRLQAEAIIQFPNVGESIANAVTLEEWNSTAEEHANYLANNTNWWDETTFLEGA